MWLISLFLSARTFLLCSLPLILTKANAPLSNTSEPCRSAQDHRVSLAQFLSGCSDWHILQSLSVVSHPCMKCVCLFGDLYTSLPVQSQLCKWYVVICPFQSENCQVWYLCAKIPIDEHTQSVATSELQASAQSLRKTCVSSTQTNLQLMAQVSPLQARCNPLPHRSGTFLELQ